MQLLENSNTSQKTPESTSQQNHPSYQKRNQIIEQYLPLIKKIACSVIRNHCQSLDYDDLVTAGVLGLMQSIDNYDTSHEVSFAGYCKLRVRGAMYDELRSLDWVPRHIRKEQKNLEQTKQQLQAQLDRSPGLSEIAEQMQIPLKTLHRYENNQASLKTISLFHMNNCEQDESNPGDFLPDPKSIEPNRAEQHRETLLEMIKGLNKTETIVMILYYQEELTMQQIGTLMGISESRICQIHKQTIKHLKLKLIKQNKTPETRLRMPA